MPEFISKLQHNTYEKGEFSDEKSRNLEQTIELVTNFPWDKERTLTDIQLTGPSVTIQDEYVNYLKLGLYFNGKFCLYYLDRDNHLFEYHAPDIKTVGGIITDFFNDQLDLTRFEKNFFNIGNRPHFVTNYFEYRAKGWPLILQTLLLICVSVWFLKVELFLLNAVLAWFFELIVALIAVFFYAILLKIYIKTIRNRDNYLQISKGSDIFSFGYKSNEIKTYSKRDINGIVTFLSSSSRRNDIIEDFEIIFNDRSSIKFSNMLISRSHFYEKFTDAMGNPTIPFIVKESNIFDWRK